ncbi:hypothetical protein BDW22DRAFT_1365719 [Trametopsis cervina]|nr:hypothetical protein BDW22DRAFT_1365719 [Trametopsis cervina]
MCNMPSRARTPAKHRRFRFTKTKVVKRCSRCCVCNMQCKVAHIATLRRNSSVRCGARGFLRVYTHLYLSLIPRLSYLPRRGTLRHAVATNATGPLVRWSCSIQTRRTVLCWTYTYRVGGPVLPIIRHRPVPSTNPWCARSDGIGGHETAQTGCAALRGCESAEMVR